MPESFRGWIPVIGWGAALVDNYCLGALDKSQNVYQAVCALDSLLSVARSGSINAGILGVGGAVAPAEALAPIHDTVKTLSDFLTASIMLLMIEKQSMGMLTLLCLKWALTCGLLCLLIASFMRKPLPALKKGGSLLCKAAVCIWLILPITALAAGFIDKFYITPKYDAQAAHVKSEIARVFQIQPQDSQESIGSMAARAVSAWNGQKNGSLVTSIKELFAHLKGAASNPNDLASLAMLLFSQIAVIVFVVPFLVLLILFGLCRIILRTSSLQ